MKPKQLLLIVILLGEAAVPNLAMSQAAQASTFSREKICKASVSVIMGRSVSTMKARTAGDVVKVWYVRADDSSTWKYKCKLEGTRVLWGSDPGRWRTDPADETVFYSVSGKGASARLTVEERYSDGSATKELFTTKQLQ